MRERRKDLHSSVLGFFEPKTSSCKWQKHNSNSLEHERGNLCLCNREACETSASGVAGFRCSSSLGISFLFAFQHWFSLLLSFPYVSPSPWQRDGHLQCGFLILEDFLAQFSLIKIPSLVGMEWLFQDYPLRAEGCSCCIPKALNAWAF